MTDPKTGQVYTSPDKKIRIYIDDFTRVNDAFALVSICPAAGAYDMSTPADEIEINDFHDLCSRFNLLAENTPATK